MIFTISNYEYDCTKRCRLVSHGNAITAALTKRSVSDEQLAAYIAKTCRNFANILDEYGRSALHMAASVGRYAIVEWLINQGASITQKDTESGHTALHRAAYYGSVGAAVLLVKYGASLEVPDEDFVNPLQLCSSVAGGRNSATDLGPELMIWGQNRNYNLGIGNVQGRAQPESAEHFRKTRTTIDRVAISAYHSVFLTHGTEAEVYATGHGVGGRLGMGIENTIAHPAKVAVPVKAGDRIIDVATGKHHTLILTESSSIYSCGENTHCQLGINPPPAKQLTPKEITGQSVLTGKTIKRIIARDYHSIAIAEADVYVWGLNGGQFGLKRDTRSETIILPKAMPLIPEGTNLKNLATEGGGTVKRDTTIRLIESSNAAIVVYTESKYLHIFTGFKVKTYKKPLMEKIACLSVTGGELQTSLEDVPRQTGDLRVIVFTSSRNIYIWYDDCQQFVRCVFAQSRNLEVDKILWCADSALVLLLGHLYHGTISNKLPRSARAGQFSGFTETSNRKELCETLQSRIELKRIRHLSNVIDFVCDTDGENYAALVENSRRCFAVPELVESNYDYGTLLADASEEDAVHDVVFYVEGQSFAAHRFILYHRSEFLRRLLKAKPEQKEFHLKECGLDGLTCGAFKLALRYLYTNQLVARVDVVRLLKKPGDKQQPDPAEIIELCGKLKAIFDRMHLGPLARSVKTLVTEPPIEPFPKLRHDSYPELYDLTIQLQGGETLRAHKCVLVARLEYFAMMFAHSWGERKTTADLKTVPREYMDVIVPFLYDNDYGRTREQRYSENFLFSMIIICDQFFIEELKSVFETIISERIQLRNVGELLEFGFQYNCEVLKMACMQYISVNFARLLEWHLLEGLEPTVLVQVDRFYKEFFQLEAYRTITPFSDAIADEELEKFVRNFRVDLEEKMESKEKVAAVPIRSKQVSAIPKVSRLQQEKRNFEKEAMAYLQRLSFEEAATAKERKTSASSSSVAPSNGESKRSLTPERRKPDVDVVGEAGAGHPTKAWQKVVTPSDAKRKSALSAALKANEVMKSETKPVQSSGEGYSNLRTMLDKAPTPPQRTPDEGYESANGAAPPNAIVSPISLGDFSLQKGKLSQKQRKRLSSTTEKPSLADNVNQQPQQQQQQNNSPSPPVEAVNPWKNVNAPPVADLLKIQSSEAAGSPQPSAASAVRKHRKSTNENHGNGNVTMDATQLATLPSSKQQRQRLSSSRLSGGEKDFSEILADERRTKQYFEKIKSKSLIHTQIEERAIEELREFYSVDKVCDEHITIERYRPLLEGVQNFAVWQYQ
uniref:BTB domain-containing protein n=2 Tax=Anopheles triannulatus TaxID=58253 RepID=A0A2M4AFK3_9DIPT